MFHWAFRGGNSTIQTRFRRFSVLTTSLTNSPHRSLLPLIAALLVAVVPLAGREKEKLSYGEGLIVNIPMPESQVAQVVEDVADNGVIRGTKEYNKDEFVSGAKAAATARVFPDWTEGGKVFYKVREHAIDPRNFKDGGDVGTLVVRYVVQPQGEKNTVLRIDALFQEDFRRTVHQSDGSVENSEYKDIREHLENIKLMQDETAAAEKERQARLARKQNAAMGQDADASAAGQSTSRTLSQDVGSSDSGSTDTAMQSSSRDLSQDEASETPAQAASGQTQPAQSLEERVKELRKQVQRLVKAPGAPLKSAPFHTAGTLQLLGTGTEVLILINTPYWYGVETHEGQHGWIMRDQLEQP
jgi:polyhydroxyalkanoate synthesis regulator phasin